MDTTTLTIEATQLLQEASIIADDIRKQHPRKVPVPQAFSRKFFALVDKLNLRLMEDKDNFYGYFLFQMGKSIRFDITDASAVNFKGTQYVIYFNPLQFLPLSPEQMGTSIKHQILHIVSLHLIRARELRHQYSRLAMNLAMDVVVNTYLDHLPPFSTTLDWVNMNYGLVMTPFESFEYYADHIQTAIDLRTDKKDLPEEESKSDENVSVSYDAKHTHDIWDDSDDLDTQSLQKFTAKFIDAAHKGKLSNYLESMIESLKDEENALPWHWYLKKLVGSVASGIKKTTMRRDRRQPSRLDLPGRLRAHKARLFIALDISGSISDSEFKQAMQEVLHIVRHYDHEVTIIECDDEIRRVYAVRRLEDVKKRLDVHGGTAYSPVFEYANTHPVDLLVYFTDGKGEEKLTVKPQGYKVLWVLSGRGTTLSVKEPYGLVKKLKHLSDYDPALDFDDVEKGGFSMNNQEGISMG